MFNSKNYYGVVAAMALLLGCNDVERVDPGVNGAGWEATTELSSAEVSSSSNTVIASSSSLMLSGSSSSLSSAQSSVSSSVSGGSSSADIVSSSSGGVSSCSSSLLSSSSSARLNSQTCSEMIGSSVTCPNDGQYTVVSLGGANWMGSNLRFVPPSSASGAVMKCYENNSDNCIQYGGLYDWKTAMEACPPNWHLPSLQEWKVLVLAADAGSTGAGNENDPAVFLRSTDGWNNVVKQGTDAFNFTARAGGYWQSYTPQGFTGLGNQGFWWTSTPSTTAGAHQSILIQGLNSVLTDYSDYDADLLSVRCVRDP